MAPRTDRDPGNRDPANRVIESLRGVLDPELGINVVDLGLVYEVKVEEERVQVWMGVTTPTCPLGPHLVESARAAVRAALPSVTEIEVTISLDPPWSPERMSPEARRQLGWDG